MNQHHHPHGGSDRPSIDASRHDQGVEEPLHSHHAHGHEHHHHDDEGHVHGEMSELSEVEIRVRALETLLVKRDYVDTDSIDALIQLYETKVGPRNGAKVVAKAWTDPAYKQWLLQDADAAIASLGFTGRQGEHMVVVENTPEMHNMVVCTLCSCYPWPVLGLPPTWYKAAPYRAKAVIDPRGVLTDFGVELPPESKITVWDSTAEVRYLVLPMRPTDSDHLDTNELEALVTRNSMIGTGFPTPTSQPGTQP